MWDVATPCRMTSPRQCTRDDSEDTALPTAGGEVT